jgi:hypothetical protein
MRLDQKRKSSCHIINKTLYLQNNNNNNKRVLKAAREKGQEIYKERPIRITRNFSTETLKAWIDALQTQKNHRCQPRLLYLAKLSITIHGENKIFQDKSKCKQYLSTNPALQKIPEEKLQLEANYREENTGNK